MLPGNWVDAKWCAKVTFIGSQTMGASGPRTTWSPVATLWGRRIRSEPRRELVGEHVDE